MLSSKIVAGSIATLTLLVSAASSFGLAALAGGAKTSCKPTSTNPALRQIQINADPLNVESFQLTMSYQNNLVTYNPQTDIFGVNGYQVNDSSTVVRGNTTYVTVLGSTQDPLAGENDVFGIVFTLLPGLPLDQPLEFDVATLGNDSVTAFDTDTGDQITYTGAEVLPSYSGPVAILPEPSAMGLMMAAVGTGTLRRRR